MLIFVAGFSCGVTDTNALVPMAGLILGTIATGPLFDTARRNGQDMFAPLAVGFGLLLFAFVPIWVSFASYTNPPSFVNGIIAVVTALYWSFGFVPVLSVCRRESAPYFWSESAYAVLSLSSKLSLGYLFAVGYVARFG